MRTRGTIPVLLAAAVLLAVMGRGAVAVEPVGDDALWTAVS